MVGTPRGGYSSLSPLGVKGQVMYVNYLKTLGKCQVFISVNSCTNNVSCARNPLPWRSAGVVRMSPFAPIGTLGFIRCESALRVNPCPLRGQCGWLEGGSSSGSIHVEFA